ncbi:hypothetical protein CHS0354_017574 [Potamilus streckersoni]|uniref:Uncharacterized protein n=1 Tax=Potamilus streckersoni TaxID=2493646 RepID=A0AAE0VHC5_9BIVA|nr:hypothetical protein CHS0354_017574 [Potamilus streckersoni]
MSLNIFKITVPYAWVNYHIWFITQKFLNVYLRLNEQSNKYACLLMRPTTFHSGRMNLDLHTRRLKIFGFFLFPVCTICAVTAIINKGSIKSINRVETLKLQHNYLYISFK